MIAAGLIASLGLVANSPAVVIGAMLVSPLIIPIFGMALEVIRGDARLLGRAVGPGLHFRPVSSSYNIL